MALALNTDAGDPPNWVVRARDLRKSYGQTEALRGIDLTVQRGELFGLIGPDGAGKSTLLQILSGVLRRTTGEVSVLGQSPRQARLEVGYVTQHFSLYKDLTVAENLSYAAGVRKVSKSDYEKRAGKYLAMMELAPFANRLAGKLSGGMKEKLSLCCALIAQPQVLLLDEPTNGLDPISRREFWQLLAAIAQEGVTTLIATANVDEAEFCTRIALVHSGRIQTVGSPAELRESLGLLRLEVRSDALTEVEEILKKALSEGAVGLADVQPFGDRIEVLVKDEEAILHIEKLLKHEVVFAQISSPEKPTLEDVFALRLSDQQKKGHEWPNFPRRFSEPVRRAAGQEMAIKAVNLRKTFGSFEAVRGSSLSVPYGSIYGLLGANGAGKTTTIQMLCGLIQPSAGEIVFAGDRAAVCSASRRRKMGYMSQKFTLYDDLTVLENLRFYASAYSVTRALRRERIEWAVSASGVSGMENTVVGRLPRGWKQRVAFCASVLHEPEILFLDEPTAGVDPLARRELWAVIRSFARVGTAILVTTHFMDEAVYCDTLALMANGHLIAQGSPGQIAEKVSGKIIEVATAQAPLAAELLMRHFEGWRVAISPDCIRVLVPNEERDWQKVRTILDGASVSVESMRIASPTLDDAFVSLVQEAKASSQ